MTIVITIGEPNLKGLTKEQQQGLRDLIKSKLPDGYDAECDMNHRNTCFIHDPLFVTYTSAQKADAVLRNRKVAALITKHTQEYRASLLSSNPSADEYIHIDDENPVLELHVKSLRTSFNIVILRALQHPRGVPGAEFDVYTEGEFVATIVIPMTYKKEV